MPFVLLWFKAFVVTLAIEVPIAARLLRHRPSRAVLGRRVAAALVVNLASHPAVWFIFPELKTSGWIILLASEAWAFGVETLIYRVIFADLSWRRALLVSGAANATSFLAGKALAPLLFR